ncbi:hypothetical protein ACFL4Z_00600 [candidate division KSB1 bacterium]
MLLETLREIYKFEHERNEKLLTRIAIYLIIVSLEFSILVKYYEDYKIPECYDILNVLFIILCSISILLLFIAFYFFYKGMFDSKRYYYGFLPSPKDIKEYYDRLVEYYSDNYDIYFKDLDTKENLIRKDFENFQIDKYIETSQVNNINNNFKSYFIYRAGQFILISVIFLLFTFVIFFFH